MERDAESTQAHNEAENNVRVCGGNKGIKLINIQMKWNIIFVFD